MLYLCTRKRQGIACRRSSAVEHVICNLGVGGPNPSAGSKKRTKKFALFFCLLTLTLNSVLSTDVSMMYFFLSKSDYFIYNIIDASLQSEP